MRASEKGNTWSCLGEIALVRRGFAPATVLTLTTLAGLPPVALIFAVLALHRVRCPPWVATR